MTSSNVHTLSVLALLGVVACRANPESSRSSGSASSPAAQLGPMLPRASRDLALEKGTSLHEVLVEMEEATGVRFLVPDETRALLLRTSSGLQRDLTVPAAETWRVVETMLIQNGLVLVPPQGIEPVLVRILSTNQGDSGVLKAHATEVDAAALAEYAHHPAVLVITVIDVQPLDARMMATTLRQLYPDQQVQSILPLGGSQLLLTGLAPDVAKMAHLLQESAARERLNLDTPAPAPAASGGASPR